MKKHQLYLLALVLIASCHAPIAKNTAPAIGNESTTHTHQNTMAPPTENNPALGGETTSPMALEKKEAEEYGTSSDKTMEMSDGAAALAMPSARATEAYSGYEERSFPKSGQLTAGEINDFHKWKMWEDLNENQLKTYRELWKISMQERYCVLVRNRSGFPVMDATCTLIDPSGATLWTSRTDNTGKAEMWLSYSNATIDSAPLRIKIESGKDTEWVDKAKPFSKGINHCKMRQACDTKNQVDIVFAVDATGSMGDEIHYLQAELLDVLQKIKAKHAISLHTGSVFYRDHGDEYVTRASGLTADMSLTTAFIQNQQAGGGGDGPEAVDDALVASIDQMNWRKTARARILFLILDAPPHSSAEHQKRLQTAMVHAAAKGIRIVPLVASGGGYEMDKSMEYLMRSLALATNGTYVFLTNHSGIGNHHTAPSTDAYEVETLNKILLRVVDQYVQAPGCNQDDWQEETMEIDNQQLVVQPLDANNEIAKEITLEAYPNPADNELWLKASAAIEEVYIADNSGKLLLRQHLNNGTNRIDTSQYPSGIYYIKVKVGSKWLSKKFIVLHI